MAANVDYTKKLLNLERPQNFLKNILKKSRRSDRRCSRCVDASKSSQHMSRTPDPSFGRDPGVRVHPPGSDWHAPGVKGQREGGGGGRVDTARGISGHDNLCLLTSRAVEAVKLGSDFGWNSGRLWRRAPSLASVLQTSKWQYYYYY